MPTDGVAEVPQFAVVRAPQDSQRHALPPGARGGSALCGVEPAEGDWYLVGYTIQLFLIPCRGCRERAADMLSAPGDGA